MKKNLKMMAVLSAAAVMTVAAPEMGFTGGSSTAYAKTIGWVEENGSFKYYEEDDYFLTDTWKKRGEDWYYLNEEGEIATNAQIDEYYVDETGNGLWTSGSPLKMKTHGTPLTLPSTTGTITERTARPQSPNGRRSAKAGIISTKTDR